MYLVSSSDIFSCSCARTHTHTCTKQRTHTDTLLLCLYSSHSLHNQQRFMTISKLNQQNVVEFRKQKKRRKDISVLSERFPLYGKECRRLPLSQKINVFWKLDCKTLFSLEKKYCKKIASRKKGSKLLLLVACCMCMQLYICICSCSICYILWYMWSNNSYIDNTRTIRSFKFVHYLLLILLFCCSIGSSMIDRRYILVIIVFYDR